VIDRNQTIHGASIRDQCSRAWFYGRDGTIEHELANFEGAAATALEEVEKCRSAPLRGSQNDYLLRLFVGLQSNRTSRRLGELRTGDKKFVEVVFKGDRAAADEFFGGELPRLGVVDLIGLAPMVTTGMLDLKCIAMEAAAGGLFVTSDHPVVLYNQYCEMHGEGWGCTGATARGLQAFLPLSPRICILLFDAGVYFIPAKAREQPLRATLNDIDSMNELQVLSAESCIYFPEEAPWGRVQRALRRERVLRARFGTRITEALAEDDSGRSLIHQYVAIPSLDMNLSFLKVRPEARQVPPDERLNLDRPEAAALLRALENPTETRIGTAQPSGLPETRTYKIVRRV
jgi:hypothetical protein